MQQSWFNLTAFHKRYTNVTSITFRTFIFCIQRLLRHGASNAQASRCKTVPAAGVPRRSLWQAIVGLLVSPGRLGIRRYAAQPEFFYNMPCGTACIADSPTLQRGHRRQGVLRECPLERCCCWSAWQYLARQCDQEKEKEDEQA